MPCHSRRKSVSQPDEVTGPISDLQQLMAWRPLVGYVEAYKSCTTASAKLMAAIDCVMFVLDRVEPSKMAALRRALVYLHSAVSTSPQAQKFVEYLARMAEDAPAADLFRPSGRPD